MKHGTFKYITLAGLSAAMTAMAFATVITRLYGTDTAMHAIYRAPWFSILWIVTAVAATVWFIVRCAYRRIVLTYMHTGLAVILAASIMTRLNCMSGYLHLRQGETSEMFVSDDGMRQFLPYSIALDSFEVECYPGTDVDRDYISHITVNGLPQTVSMNRPLLADGYRFCQSGYDPDCNGTTLSVRYNPVGDALLYTGFSILAVSLIVFLFCRDSQFKAALERIRSTAGKTLPPVFGITALAAAGILFLALSVFLALRWHRSGHIPMSDGFEMMLLIAWTSVLLAISFSRKQPVILPLGLLLAGFCILTAFLSSPASNPAQPLKPVLDSPLLAVHVTCMMFSYTLFGLVALGGVAGLFSKSGQLADICRVALYPAVFLLAIGTMLGAVWGNRSWGSCWQWDPKETWALVTLLLYSMGLHVQSLPALKKTANFNLFAVLSFLCILMTWFGVNLLLGGVHSYA